MITQIEAKEAQAMLRRVRRFVIGDSNKLNASTAEIAIADKALMLVVKYQRLLEEIKDSPWSAGSI